MRSCSAFKPNILNQPASRCIVEWSFSDGYHLRPGVLAFARGNHEVSLISEQAIYHPRQEYVRLPAAQERTYPWNPGRTSMVSKPVMVS